MRIPRKAAHVLALLVLVEYVALLGALVGAWNTNPPVGYTGDTFKQLYKAKTVSSFFPELAWDYMWSAGIPSFRAYPLWPYYLLVAISRLIGTSLELSLVIIAFFCYALIGFGMYLASYHVTRSFLAALAAALFLLATPAIWSIHVVNGLFNEIVGLVFLPIALLLAFRISEKSEQQLSPARDFALLILLSAAAIGFHPLIGMASFLSAAIVICVSKTALRTRATLALGGLLLVLGLNSYLILPVLTSSFHNVALIPESLHVTAVFVGNFFRIPSSETSFALQPWAWLVTLCAVILAISARVATGRRELALLSLAVLSTVLTLVSGQLAVGFISFTLVGFFLAATSGTLLGLLSGSTRRTARLLSSCLVLFVLFASVAAPISLSYGKTQTPLPDPTLRTMEKLQLPTTEPNYRTAVSGADAWTSQWFNYRYDIPQTSSYAGLSLINMDWNAWFGEIWQNKSTSSQRKFLLDWWAARWILLNTDVNSPTVFLQNPEDYSLVANITEYNYLEFLYPNASPIVAPTNAYSILAVGDDIAYHDFFQAMSFDAYDSRSVVPIRYAVDIEDYSIDELRDFDALVLYGFAFHDRDKAFSLLNRYVREGGAVLIDTGYSGVSSSSDLPECFPISSTFSTDFGTKWRFTRTASLILDGVGVNEFAPATYGTQPWGVSATTNSSVRDWAKPVLWDAGHPLIVSGNYGKGRALWTGLNLPYHIISHRNGAESHLLSRMIQWAVSRPISAAEFQMHRPDPQHITLSVKSEARGILLKENFFQGWKASIQSDSLLRELRIWRAGPDFMYVRLPDNVVAPLEVSFQFDTEFTQVPGIVLSVVFLAIVLCMGTMRSFTKRLIPRSFRRQIARLGEAGLEE